MNKLIKFIFSYLLLAMTFFILTTGEAQTTAHNLRDLLKMAVHNNADIQIQSRNVHITGLNHWLSISNMLPQVDAQASYIKTVSKNGVPLFITVNGVREKVAWLSLQQTIFEPNTIFGLSESHIEHQQQQIGFGQTKQDILLRVIEAYFNALETHGEIDVYRKNLQAFEILYRQSILLYNNGVVPQLDVKKSHVEYLLQQNSLNEAQRSYEMSLNQIKELISQPIEDSLSIQEFRHEKTFLDSLSFYLNQAIEKRPEIKVLQLESQRLGAQKLSAFLNLLPSARFGAFFGWDTSERFHDENLGWEFYINVSMPLLHWGRLYIDRQVAELAQRQVEIRLDLFKKQIARQVIKAYSNCQIQKKQLIAMSKSKTEAEDAVQMAKIGYQEGTVTNLEVVNSQKLLTQTNIQYLKALYNFYIYKARLYRSIGALEEEFTWLN
jgi:outer membrane protein